MNVKTRIPIIISVSIAFIFVFAIIGSIDVDSEESPIEKTDINNLNSETIEINNETELRNAITSGSETKYIVLKSDIEKLTSSLIIPNGQTITIDLNGKTISGSVQNSKESKALIDITNGSSLKITDNSTGNKGKIYNGGSATSRVVSVNADTELILDGGITLETGKISSLARSNSPIYVNIASNSDDKASIRIIDANLISPSDYTIRFFDSVSNVDISIEGGIFKAESKSNQVSSIYYGYNANITYKGGTFYNWSKSDVDKIESGCYLVVGASDDVSYVTIQESAPTDYKAIIDGTNIFLTGSNIYSLFEYLNMSDNKIVVVDNLESNFSNDYFGNKTGIQDRLTISVENGKTLSGSMPLSLAVVVVEGEGTIGENFFVPFSDTYEIIEKGGVYTCSMKSDEIAAWVIRDEEERVYDSVSTAIAAAKTTAGDILILNEDYSTSSYVSSSSSNAFDWTLDLNGHNYTYTGTASAFGLNYSGNSLYIVDNSAKGGGKLIVTKADANSAIYTGSKSNGSVISIGEGVTIEGGTILLDGTSNELYVYGSIITNNNNAAIQGNGNSTSNSTIVIKDGATVSSNLVAIYHPQSGLLKIEGGVITAKTAIYMKSGMLEVIDGTINANGDKYDYTHNPSGCNSTGDAIVLEACDYPGGVPAADICGGTISSNNNKAVACYLLEGSEDIDNKSFITGGTFSSDVSEYVASYCQMYESDGNYLVYERTTGTAVINDKYYETLEEAFKDVDDNIETTIELLEDTSISSTIFVSGDKNIILDTNGSTISWSGSVNQMFSNSGTLTVIGGGTIDATGTTEASAVLWNNASGTLMVDGGVTLAGGYNATVYSIGTTELKDATISNGTDGPYHIPVVTITNNTYTSETTIDGTTIINNGNTVAISNEGIMEIRAGTISANNAAILINNGIVNVEGGNISSSSDAIMLNSGDLIISGGNLESGTDSQCIDVPGTGDTSVSISGGSFSSEIPDEYIEEGSVLIQNPDGGYVTVSGEDVDISSEGSFHIDGEDNTLISNGVHTVTITYQNENANVVVEGITGKGIVEITVTDVVEPYFGSIGAIGGIQLEYDNFEPSSATVTVNLPVGTGLYLSGCTVMYWDGIESGTIDGEYTSVYRDGTVKFVTTHNTEYDFIPTYEAIEPDVPSYPGWDDDYPFVPPTVVTNDGSNETTKIAACAAAAAAAAILAMFIVMDYRKK